MHVRVPIEEVKAGAKVICSTARHTQCEIELLPASATAHTLAIDLPYRYTGIYRYSRVTVEGCTYTTELFGPQPLSILTIWDKLELSRGYGGSIMVHHGQQSWVYGSNSGWGGTCILDWANV